MILITSYIKETKAEIKQANQEMSFQ